MRRSRYDAVAEQRARRRARQCRRAVALLALAVAAVAVPALQGIGGRSPLRRSVASAEDTGAVVDGSAAGASFATRQLVRSTIAIDVPVSPPLEVRNDPDLERGRERLVAEGVPGIRRDAYEILASGDREVTRRLLGSLVVDPPEPRVIARGTKAANTERVPSGARPNAYAQQWRSTGESQQGRATWYQWRSGWCANNHLPRGTIVRVTNLDNGLSTFCVIMDRGLRSPHNIIDMSPDTFDDIAVRRDGVARVVVEW